MAPSRNAKASHQDDSKTAIGHFNESFRHRYGLPETNVDALGGEDAWLEATQELYSVRANGVADASCAMVARHLFARMPRYAIGFVDGDGRVAVQEPDVDGFEYRGHNAILVNPLGGQDNWRAVSRWVKRTAGDARRRELAGLGSERRRDEDEVLDTLWDAAREHGRAIVLPPDEGFSLELAMEVAYIFDLEVETLRSWKKTYRGNLSARRPGRPRKNR